MSKDKEALTGSAVVIAAYLLWGILPLYWKALKAVSALEILTHRIFWSFVFLGILVLAGGRKGEVKATFSHPKNRWFSLMTAAIITVNWLTYIWAVNAGHVVDSSLGYFINPLLSIFLGFVFLRERMNPWQWTAVLFALAGVLHLTVKLGRIPWISLVLAGTFGLYGLIRKVVPVNALVGLWAETAVISPFLLIYLAVLISGGRAATLSAGRGIHLLLIGAGVVTATPLLWFVYGVRRIPLVMAGFFQFIAPSLQFILGVFVFKEPFTRVHLVGFSLIWTGLVIFVFSNMQRRFRRPASAPGEGASAPRIDGPDRGGHGIG